MEELFNLLFQNHPDFKEEVEGCTDEEIEKLEEFVTNCKIPDDYKVFLKHIGKNPGRVYGIRRHWKTKKPVESTQHMNQLIEIDYFSVLNFYKILHKKKQFGWLNIAQDYGESAECFFLFGIDCLGNDNGNFYLDLRNPDLPVVEISGTVEFKQHSPTFRAFLFEIPFRRTLSTFEHSKKWL